MADENNKNPETPETPKNDVPAKTEKKGNLFTGIWNGVKNAGHWCVRKVRKYPKTACTIVFAIGAGAGFALKVGLDMLSGNAENEDGPIETEFQESETDSDTVIDSTPDETT